MPTPFKVTLDLDQSNPANCPDSWLFKEEFDLQTDKNFNVYFLKQPSVFATKIEPLLNDGVGVISINNSRGKFLNKDMPGWPEKTGKIAVSNPQGTQMLHADNTQSDDPRRWNYFANIAPRTAKTIVIRKELFYEYDTEVLEVVAEVRGRSRDILLSDIETSTEINKEWFKAFQNDEISPDNPLALYWFLEIATKYYRGQNYLKEELDALYADMLHRYPDQVHVQNWDLPAGLIHDNTTTLHGRYNPGQELVPQEETKNVVRLWIGDKAGANSISQLMS